MTNEIKTIKVSDPEAKQIALTNYENQAIAEAASGKLETLRAEVADKDEHIKKQTAELHETEERIKGMQLSNGAAEEKPLFLKGLLVAVKLLITAGIAVFDAGVFCAAGFTTLEGWSLGIAIAGISWLAMDYAGRALRQKDRWKREWHVLLGSVVSLIVVAGLAWGAADIRARISTESEIKRVATELDKQPQEVKAQVQAPVNLGNFIAVGLGIALGQLLLAFFAAHPTHELENLVKLRQARKKSLLELRRRRVKMSQQYQALWTETQHRIQANMQYSMAVIHAFRQGVRSHWPRTSAQPSYLNTPVPTTVFRHPWMPSPIIDDLHTHQKNLETAVDQASGKIPHNQGENDD